MAESTAVRTLAGYGYSAWAMRRTRGRVRDRAPEAERAGEWRDSPISTSATLMPSAEVPLITPATIIVFLLICAPAGGLPCGLMAQAGLVLRIPTKRV